MNQAGMSYLFCLRLCVCHSRINVNMSVKFNDCILMQLVVFSDLGAGRTGSAVLFILSANKT